MSLFSEFEPITSEQWFAQIEKDLKGKPLSSLNWKWAEGMETSPFATKSNIEGSRNVPSTSFPERSRRENEDDFPIRRGNIFNITDSGWQMVQELCIDDTTTAIEIVSSAQNTDIQAFRLFTRLTEIPILELYDVLRAIDLRRYAVHIHLPLMEEDTLYGIINLLMENGYDTKVLTGALYVTSMSETFWVEKDERYFSAFQTLGVDLAQYENNIIHQLAFALGISVEMVEYLKGEKISSPLSFASFGYHFPVGGDFFPEIAKFRAFRMLFSKLCEAYHISDEIAQSPFILASTGVNNKSEYDAYTNLLRTTTEAMSAIMGGANALNVRPFDATFNDANTFSQRISQNIQHLLKYESYLDKVSDAAGGSFYIETLTEQIAQAAWKLFQEIEAKGGFMTCLNEGFIQEIQDATQRKILVDMRKRKKVLVGINQYPDAKEIGQKIKYKNNVFYGHEYVEIRQKIDNFAQVKGKRVLANICTFGDLTMRNARALFVRNVLGCAGFEVVENAGVAADIIILCSSDAEYFEEGKNIMTSFREKYPNSAILIAGKPENMETLGADGNLYAGMDVVYFLQNLTAKWS